MSPHAEQDGAMAKRRMFHNSPPSDMPAGAPKEAVRAEFGRRIQVRLTERGWSQSDLAREASKHMPGKKNLSRDNVSNYVRGVQIPGPLRMRAICAALGVDQTMLLPPQAIQSVDDKAPPLQATTLSDGRMFLQINQVTTLDVAMKIMALLGTEKL